MWLRKLILWVLGSLKMRFYCFAVWALFQVTYDTSENFKTLLRTVPSEGLASWRIGSSLAAWSTWSPDIHHKYTTWHLVVTVIALRNFPGSSKAFGFISMEEIESWWWKIRTRTWSSQNLGHSCLPSLPIISLGCWKEKGVIANEAERQWRRV